MTNDWRTFEDVGRLLEAQSWIFAKTMPENPHEYTLRKRWDDDAAFVRVVTYLREHGYTAHFRGRPYVQLDVNEHFYWTMGAPLNATILINRKVRQEPAPYDALAPAYDALFTDEESRAEDEAVLTWLGDLSDKRVLDVGCGTGWLLDHATPAVYTGLDPSLAMLDVLCAKYLARRGDVVCCPLRSFVPAASGGYDLIVALYGVGSYLTEDELRRIPSLLAPGGRFCVMAYAPDYAPRTHRCLKEGELSPLTVIQPGTALLCGVAGRLATYTTIEGGPV